MMKEYMANREKSKIVHMLTPHQILPKHHRNLNILSIKLFTLKIYQTAKYYWVSMREYEGQDKNKKIKGKTCKKSLHQIVVIYGEKYTYIKQKESTNEK